MDPQRIENEHIVARYVTGQLSAADALAFESYYAQNPDMVREIEHTLRLREGLAVLQDRGELAALIRVRPRWPIPASLAAALVIVIVGVWMWRGPSSSQPSALVAGITQIQGVGAPPVSISSTHLLARIRGEQPVIQIALPREPAAIELRMVPSARRSVTQFSVTLQRLDGQGDDQAMGILRAERNAGDGVVTAYLDSTQLSPGRYAVELAPEGDDATDRFVIDLR